MVHAPPCDCPLQNSVKPKIWDYYNDLISLITLSNPPLLSFSRSRPSGPAEVSVSPVTSAAKQNQKPTRSSGFDMGDTKVIPIAYVEENGLVGRIKGLYNAFHLQRSALGLLNPGTVEGVSREVTRDVFLTNSMFTGLRADITKVFSVNPVFHTSHAFSVGSQGLPPYTFVSTFGTDRVSGADMISVTILNISRSPCMQRSTMTVSYQEEAIIDGAEHWLQRLRLR